MKNKKLFIITAVIVTAGVLTYLLIFIIPFSEGPIPKKEAAPKGLASFVFNSKAALKCWEEKIFKGRVIYSIKAEGPGGYLNALSKSAASAIMYWMKFMPAEKPMVRWKWKVTQFPQARLGAKGDGSWVEADDYA
ncbi:DUF3047 domain-containing protein, partial [Candidatus Omnitrophota bacterium]